MTQKIKTLVLVTSLILIFTSFKPSEACRLLDGGFEEPWMKRGNLLLSSLPRGEVRPPGNGCSNTGNGGNPCIGSKNIVGGHGGGVGAPPPPPLIHAQTFNIL